MALGDSAAMAQELAALVVGGVKTATAGLLWSYEAGAEPAPQPGQVSVVTDFAGQLPLAVIETTDVRVGPFSSCDEGFAWDEGEGERTLSWWREAHWEFFTRECERLGQVPSESMPVVFERFKLLFPGGSPPR